MLSTSFMRARAVATPADLDENCVSPWLALVTICTYRTANNIAYQEEQLAEMKASGMIGY